MSRAEAIAYLQEYTAVPLSQIKVEVDCYITFPGQACSYKIGERTILQLRREAEERLGALFDIKDFHKVVLEVGRAPLDILDYHVHQWIQEASPSTPRSTILIRSSSTSTSLNSCCIIVMSVTLSVMVAISVKAAFKGI